MTENIALNHRDHLGENLNRQFFITAIYLAVIKVRKSQNCFLLINIHEGTRHLILLQLLLFY